MHGNMEQTDSDQRGGGKRDNGRGGGMGGGGQREKIGTTVTE